MKIRKITEDTLDAAISFSDEKCIEGVARSYQLYENKDEIRTEYIRNINEPNRELLGCYKEDTLIGVLGYYTLPEDHYLQTTAFYIEDGMEAVFDLFINYMERHYSNYSIFIGVVPTYTIAMKKLAEYKYELISDSIDFRLDKNDKLEHQTIFTDLVKKIDDVEFDQYLKFHKEFFDADAGYWTSDRISSCREQWNIYVVYDNEDIVSAMYVRNIKDMSEVYGAYVITENHAEMLFQYASNDLFNKYQDMKTFMIMLETYETDSISAAQKVGFRQKSRYCCWKKQI